MKKFSELTQQERKNIRRRIRNGTTVASLQTMLARIRSVNPEGTVKYRRQPKKTITCYKDDNNLSCYKID